VKRGKRLFSEGGVAANNGKKNNQPRSFYGVEQGKLAINCRFNQSRQVEYQKY
jgi:hypothetical protein